MLEKMPASIFNDVIGPVMRGPSSSHVAGAWRIAQLVRQSINGKIGKIVVDFDINGSLAESHDGHGTDMGFVGGMIGMDMTDPALPQAQTLAEQEGIDIVFNVCDYGAEHPNNYRITANSKCGKTYVWEAISVGGGMVEMQRFNGFDISISGGYHELLITVELADEQAPDVVRRIEERFANRVSSSVSTISARTLLSLQFETAPDDPALQAIRELPFVSDIVQLYPILPTPSRAACRVPFYSASQLLAMATSNTEEMWRFAVMYESARGGECKEEIFRKMNELFLIMKECVRTGLAGTRYEDRILGPQAHLMARAAAAGRILPCDILNTAIQYVTAIMEVKSSMGVIVASPTAGSCGCLPGVILAVGEVLKLGEEEMVKGLLTAGLIGVFIAESATFAAEVAGCQVECGAASGMAAAGLAQMYGGTARQCIDAASIALQNITGLACDPVANRVEVPCLGKNIMGAANAIAAANMALAGFDTVIPLDETISALYDVGTKLPLELRCTCGGLGKTDTALRIRKRLASSAD